MYLSTALNDLCTKIFVKDKDVVRHTKCSYQTSSDLFKLLSKEHTNLTAKCCLITNSNTALTATGTHYACEWREVITL